MVFSNNDPPALAVLFTWLDLGIVGVVIANIDANTVTWRSLSFWLAILSEPPTLPVTLSAVTLAPDSVRSFITINR